MQVKTATPDDSDDELVQACTQGDPQALTKLFDRYASQVHRVAYRICGSVDDADDVVQDLFVGLPRALRTYRATGSFAAWLHSVAARTSLLHLRRNRRTGPAITDVHRSEPTESSALLGLDVQRALSRLPEDLRVVFLLKEQCEMTHEEIAEALGISRELSKVRLFRARKKLRAFLHY
jgi:RNA polymerase sigma-70 factor (ECF subfamily)